VAMAARAAELAAAAGSMIVGMVVLPRVSFFENAAIMIRASHFCNAAIDQPSVR
jgi:hypothetical protein